jgi:non-specific serine/threonine protein kinase
VNRPARPEAGSARVQRGRGRRGSGLLPAESTSFVGRETELARVAALLRTSRLVTVTGVGGVGKSRVALRAARDAAARYPDGARLAELSGLSGLSGPSVNGQLQEVVTAALGVTGAGPDALLDYLRDRSMLLILDTCEHLADECAILAETILREAPGVTLLATSRQPLDLPGEATYQIPPLRVPAPGAGVKGSEAVELFAQRAAAAVPGFTVTAENQADVVRLCQRLDGLPLAIELAAVRLRALPLSQLASRREGGFSLVTGGRRGAPDRHQTLADAIAWSYGLCTPAERALWERLSAFAGPFDLDAAEEVCAGGDLPARAVTETIVRLVDKSVLLREPAMPWEEGEVNRYRLLDTMREFGARRLAEAGPAGPVRGQFVARYAGLARSFDDHLLADGQLDRCRKLRAEHPNIEAALEYGLAGRHGPRRRKQDGAALAVALRAYWLVSGMLTEGRHWLSRAAALFPGDTRERASALAARASLGAFQGQHDESAADAVAAAEIAARLGEERLAARAHLALALTLTFAGRLQDAAGSAAEAERRLASLGDHAGLCLLDMQLAHLAIAAGDPVSAIARAAAGLDRLGQGGPGQHGPGQDGSGQDGSGRGGELWLHGCLHLTAALALATRHGSEAECAAALATALRAASDLGDVTGAAFAIEAYAWLAARTRRAERAAWLLGAAGRRWETAGGRLAGAAYLEVAHRQAADAARQALGQRYDTLSHRGARLSLEEAAGLATGDADELPGPAEAAAPAALTSRERQIAGLVASGLSNREIAERAGISKRTVDAHVEHIFGKLRLKSRVQLTVWFRENSDRSAG